MVQGVHGFLMSRRALMLSGQGSSSGSFAYAGAFSTLLAPTVAMRYLL